MKTFTYAQPSRLAVAGLATALLTIGSSGTLNAACTTTWSDQFNNPFIDGTVKDSVVWNDGTGPALYIVGQFQDGMSNLVGLTPENKSRGVMKWNGTTWSIVGPAAIPPSYTGAGYIYLTGDKRAVTTWDPDGAGPLASRLVVGGFATPQGDTPVAEFDGTAWTLLNNFCPLTVVNDLIEFQPVAGGPNLLVCAGYTGEGAAIATYDYAQDSWEVVGTMYSQGYYASRMTIHDDDGAGPTRPALYIAGKFIGVTYNNQQDITPAAGLARWDGTNWSDIAGFPGFQNNRGTYFGTGGLTALGSFDTGDGPSLWVAGVREGTAEAVYRWRNSAWEKMFDGQAYSFVMYGPAGQEKLHFAGGQLAQLHRMNSSGTGWEVLGQPVDPSVSPNLGAIALNMIVADLDFAGPQPPSIVLCTPNSNFYGLNVRPTGLQWNGTNFDYLPVGSGGILGIRSSKILFEEIDADGAGPAQKRFMVYGDIDGVGRHVFGSECLWFDGNDFSGTPPYNTNNMAGDPSLSTGVNDVEVYNNGTGTTLYATVAQRYSISDDCRSALVRLNGTQWDDAVIASLGDCSNQVELQNLLNAPLNGQESLILMGMYDQLTITNSPFDITTLSARGCAYLTGTQWTAMDLGLPSEPMFISAVMFDNQPHVLVSDSTYSVNRIDTRVMRWNQEAGWETVGGAFFDHSANGIPAGMRVLDLGTGPQLYVFGTFGSVNSVPGTAKLARWNGSQWASVNTELDVSGAGVNDLAVFDLGAGPRLIAATTGSSLPANLRGIIALEGSAWTLLTAPQTTSPVSNLFGTNLPGAAGLYVSGFLNGLIDGKPCYGLARLMVDCACPADFNSSGTVTVQDIFDFLSAWFAGTPTADFNHVGGVTVQDIFDFLGAWFAGC